MVCRLCDQNKKTGNSHIIPKGFFRQLRSGSEPPEMHTNSPGEFTKKVPVGVYDQNILCADCEKAFDLWDDHAQKVLVHDSKMVTAINGHNAFRVQAFDYDRLQMFFVSLIWRASVSTHPFYKSVALGPLESVAKERIKRGKPGANDVFETFLSRFGESNIEKTILDPRPERIEGVKYYRFYLAGFMAHIKADSRQGAPEFREFHLKPNSPLFIIGRDFSSSRESIIIPDVVKETQ